VRILNNSGFFSDKYNEMDTISIAMLLIVASPILNVSKSKANSTKENAARKIAKSSKELANFVESDMNPSLHIITCSFDRRLR